MGTQLHLLLGQKFNFWIRPDQSFLDQYVPAEETERQRLGLRVRISDSIASFSREIISFLCVLYEVLQEIDSEIDICLLEVYWGMLVEAKLVGKERELN